MKIINIYYLKLEYKNKEFVKVIYHYYKQVVDKLK